MTEEVPRVRLTPSAVQELKAHETLVFDWVRVPMCCGAAGEISLRRSTTRETAKASSLVPLDRENALPVFAHRRALSMLLGQTIVIDCYKRFGIRSFTHDLPPDFGLRAVFGRPTATPKEAEPWPQPPAPPATS